ncbi:hypothetical protein E0Z10_g5251 [Xylaria hypoxylon]|uniref:Phosphatidic acid phosphatase type 2/haloperoxidase domain-containing protein n=1 Tax=Xylaria hypoxylon TaxID=37992 RepID=A0A4Z0Z4C2_9PEZI|nr:hypothetical protein E0Z10_g5251 [Xylaria hypoxylon]
MQSPNASTAVASPLPRSNAKSEARRMSSASSTRDPYSIEKRPTFGKWIKVTWLDIVTIFLVAAFAFPVGYFYIYLPTLGLGTRAANSVEVYYLAFPIGVRVFPLDVHTDKSNSTASVIPPSFAYPARPQMVSNWLIALIAIFFPTAVILLMQIRIRNFWDLNNSLLGFCYALLTSAALQSTVKAFVGGLRPNFYDICQPDSEHAKNGGNKTGLNGIGFRGDMWSKDVCTTTNHSSLRNAMQGFPSGHSTTMVAAMVYLSLYLNAKLKVFANYHTPLWKLIALVVPILGAVLLCGTLVIDNTHSWYDIAGGATIGILVSSAAFRMVYPSIFDWRINHIPLNRNVPFDGQPRQDLVVTTRAGWRSPVKENDTTSAPDLGHDELDGENGNGSSTPNRVGL